MDNWYLHDTIEGKDKIMYIVTAFAADDSSGDKQLLHELKEDINNVNEELSTLKQMILNQNRNEERLYEAIIKKWKNLIK